ncbi:MAG: PEP-CTERM sorting domain-containing protein [Burkholderiaceae bacterium]
MALKITFKNKSLRKKLVSGMVRAKESPGDNFNHPTLKGHLMKLLKTALSCAVILCATVGTAQASMINVGGVTWDPDAVSISDSDFTARYDFNEFFTHGSDAVANSVNAAPDYSKAINPGIVTGGDVLQGVGEVYKFNGVNYGDTSSTTGGAFCPSCELTFVFGGFTVTGPNSFSNGWLRLYVDNTPDFNVSMSSADKAADGTLFLELTAKTNQFTSFDGFSSGFLASYFDVTGGIAAKNFDTNTQRFAADLLSNATGQFSNPNFIATSTGVISGNSIPEPSTVMLMGLALMGLVLVKRKTRA